MKASRGFRPRHLGTGLAVGLILSLAAPGGGALAASSGGWHNLGNGATPTSNALNGKVETLYRDGPTVYVGGDFTDAAGIPTADRVAKWNGSSWSAVGGGITGGAVYAIAVDGVDVYVGGSTQFTGTLGDSHIAMWNGSSWQSLGFRLNGPVFAMAIVGRTLYIGGGFDNAANIATADGIVAYGLDSHAWSAITAGNNDIGGTIAAIAPDGGTGIYVCGSFLNAVGNDASDFIVHYASGVWTPLGNNGSTGGAIRDRCRGLAVTSTDVYIVGDFINVSGTNQADKVARYSIASHHWSAVGPPAFFSAAQAVSLYAVAVDGPRVLVAGGFLNAGGNARIDGLADFTGGTWTNIGTNADGTNGPASGLMLALLLVDGRLYAGGLDSAIGGGSKNASLAWFSLHRPDARIKVSGGIYVGNDVYNTSAQGQRVQQNVPRGSHGRFRVRIGNDASKADRISVQGAPSTTGFTIHYFNGTMDITSQVVAGTYAFSLAPGTSSPAITVDVAVGPSQPVGAVSTFLIRATSTGAEATQDVVAVGVRVS